jgi:hypothetical protein
LPVAGWSAVSIDCSLSAGKQLDRNDGLNLRPVGARQEFVTGREQRAKPSFVFTGGDLRRDAFVLQCSAPAGICSVTVALQQPRDLKFHGHWLDGATSFEVMTQTGCLDANQFKLLQFLSTVEGDARSQPATCL